MSGETILTIVGRLTADPELRFTPSGVAVANFTIASNPRVFDRQTGEWKDGDAIFMHCHAWKRLGELAADGIRKGDIVIVRGKLKSRTYEDRNGVRHTVFEVDADEIGRSVWNNNRPEQAAPAAPVDDPLANVNNDIAPF